MYTEHLMRACRRPVQKAMDAIYVRTGIPFHAVAPWLYVGAFACVFVEGAIGLGHVLGSTRILNPFLVLGTVVVPVIQSGAYGVLAKHSRRFSRAAATDPWLHADPAYRVQPAEGAISFFLVMLLIGMIFSVKLFVEATAWLWQEPGLILYPSFSVLYVAVACSCLGRVIGTLAVLVAGCERCRKGRNEKMAKHPVKVALRPSGLPS